MARITSGDVGRRVTVRRQVPGGLSDVVGDLVSCTDDQLVVRDKDDTEHELSQADVVAARVVRPLPAAARAAELERVAAAGWPAVEVEPLGDWLLRAAGGFTGRANSCLAVGDPGMPHEAAADAVRSWYTARGLAPAAATVLGSREDDGFAALGWAPSPTVLVQVADLADLAQDPSGTVLDAPSEAWLARYTARGEVTDVGRRVLTGGDTVGFAQADLTGLQPAAIGRGVVVGEWLGISAVEVAADARRSGLATQITAALAAWGAREGARRAYLQVQADNAPARALYEGLGFRTHHRYRYRRYPDSSVRNGEVC